ncbi:hypothetical protein BRADI_2g58025v3 [Brachypodium distachyon]|uniref:Uncharacterized protein n=1 Tax=Brachypodium distachyon TaxID=15368 RepID=A0A2K2DGK5_BRADI|nr:hypothetical protein BRADI_2g58025v3 [Brachypodium distachyon]PNT73408.1 hypothetical protein BRADI_2g58025v3 [Brachypodium distachyon]
MLVVDTREPSPQCEANEELNHWRFLFRYAKRGYTNDKATVSDFSPLICGARKGKMPPILQLSLGLGIVQKHC